MILSLLACSPAPSLEDSAPVEELGPPSWELSDAGTFEDDYGHPRELLAGCSFTEKVDGELVLEMGYDERGYPLWTMQHGHGWDLHTELDELERPTRSTSSSEGEVYGWSEGAYVDETSWRLERFETHWGLVEEYRWGNSSYTVNPGDCETVVRLAEGLRPSRSEQDCEDSKWTTEWTWFEGRLVQTASELDFDGSPMQVTETIAYDSEGRLESRTLGPGQPEVTLRDWDCPTR